MEIGDLNLVSIDGMRHLVVSEEVVTATAFAARAGFSDVTCYRFVVALVMTDTLKNVGQWRTVLAKVCSLKISAEFAAIEDLR